MGPNAGSAAFKTLDLMRDDVSGRFHVQPHLQRPRSALVRTQKTRVFLDRETVGHPGDIVGNDTGERGFANGFCHVLAPLFRQKVGPLHEKREKLIDHLRDMAAHIDDRRCAVHPGKQESADFLQIGPEIGRKPNNGSSGMANVFDTLGRQICDPGGRNADHILYQNAEKPAQRFVPAAVIIQTRVGSVNLGEAAPENWQFGQFIGRKQLCPQPVMQIMAVVCNVIRDCSDLRLGAGMGRKLQIVGPVVIFKRIGRRRR